MNKMKISNAVRAIAECSNISESDTQILRDAADMLDKQLQQTSLIQTRADGQWTVTTGPRTVCFGSMQTAAEAIASYQQELLARVPK